MKIIIKIKVEKVIYMDEVIVKLTGVNLFSKKFVPIASKIVTKTNHLS